MRRCAPPRSPLAEVPHVINHSRIGVRDIADGRAVARRTWIRSVARYTRGAAGVEKPPAERTGRYPRGRAALAADGVPGGLLRRSSPECRRYSVYAEHARRPAESFHLTGCRVDLGLELIQCVSLVPDIGLQVQVQRLWSIAGFLWLDQRHTTNPHLATQTPA